MLNGLMFLVSLFGHTAIGCMVFNRLHASRIPRVRLKLLERLFYVGFVLVVAWLSWVFTRMAFTSALPDAATAWSFEAWLPATSHALKAYVLLCALFAVAMPCCWLWRRLRDRTPASVVNHRSHRIDFSSQLTEKPLRGLQARLLGMIPGNQTLQLSVEHRNLELPQWPKELNGLTIAHLSDLHLTGKVHRKYFQLVCQECNQCAPDMIFLTGDVVDRPECLDWLPDTIGTLRAPGGKFYILGNHDRRVPEQDLRQGLADAGFQPAGDWQPVSHRGAVFHLAGNELPWYRGAEHLTRQPAAGPTVLLSHTPDHLGWARRRGIDLVFSGHTHGGQIRLPLIGPLICPSNHGVRYASGSFQLGNTLMHVSRGISGDQPIRLNCPPELGIYKISSAD